jgi:hypothetical protein
MVASSQALFHVDPAPVQGGGDVAGFLLCSGLAEFRQFGFKLGGKAGALAGLLAEKRLQVCRFGMLGRVLVSLLSVPVGVDKFGYDIHWVIAVHEFQTPFLECDVLNAMRNFPPYAE